jgi:hypothetical protein
MSATDDAIVIAAILDVMREPPQRRHAPRTTVEALTGFSRGARKLFLARLEEVYGKRLVRAALREERERFRESERRYRESQRRERERERREKIKRVVKVI